ncbi:hypothetical protein GA0061100_110115 [Rhizobium hainanense]|uniref:Uncharacterized protein n=1 Tax=Rhizobium hainanense TaxID=52131 RepID=A0A1C3W2H7_9HYPH|nr:hypothetical protein GA0061100_110115 [Rhizobium hainanense]
MPWNSCKSSLAKLTDYDCRVPWKTAIAIHLDRDPALHFMRIWYNACAI